MISIDIQVSRSKIKPILIYLARGISVLQTISFYKKDNNGYLSISCSFGRKIWTSKCTRELYVQYYPSGKILSHSEIKQKRMAWGTKHNVYNFSHHYWFYIHILPQTIHLHKLLYTIEWNTTIKETKTAYWHNSLNLTFDDATVKIRTKLY